MQGHSSLYQSLTGESLQPEYIHGDELNCRGSQAAGRCPCWQPTCWCSWDGSIKSGSCGWAALGRQALEDPDGCDPPVCQNSALETARLELPGPPDVLLSLSGLCDLPRQASGLCTGPLRLWWTHAICQWHGVTSWAPLEASLQSSRLVAWALIIRSNCGLRFHKPGGCAGGGQAAKVTPKSLLNRWCER